MPDLHVVVKRRTAEFSAAVVHPAVGDPGWTEYDRDKYTVFLHTKETISVALALGKLLRLSCDMLARNGQSVRFRDGDAMSSRQRMESVLCRQTLSEGACTRVDSLVLFVRSKLMAESNHVNR